MPQNAPRALLDLTASWIQIPPGEYSENVRGIEGDGDISFWRDQAVALNLVVAIERDIRALEATGVRVDQFTKHLPMIYRFIFGYTAPWGHTEPHGRIALPETVLDALVNLGELVETRELEPEWSEYNAEALDEQLALVVEMVSADVQMDAASQKYLMAVVAELVQANRDVGRFGTAFVRRLSNELAGLLLAQADVAHEAEPNGQRAQGFFEAARRIAYIAAEKLITKAIEIGSGLALKALD